MNPLPLKLIKTAVLIAIIVILLGKYDMIIKFVSAHLLRSDNILAAFTSIALISITLPLAIFVASVIVLFKIWRSRH